MAEHETNEMSKRGSKTNTNGISDENAGRTEYNALPEDLMKHFRQANRGCAVYLE